MHSAVEIPLAMLLVFAAAKLLAEFCERIGQPGIVGEIVAGVLIGPHVLGWLHATDFLSALADLGVMFLLFRVGLEVKASDLFRVGPTALGVAVAGVVLPFASGYAIAALWNAPRVECVFVGAALVATSVGITAHVLAARGLLSLQASRIILAAAVIDDVLGLIVLAVASGVAGGKVDYLDIGLTTTLALAFTFFVARFAPRTLGRILPHLRSRLRLADAEFALAMVLLFALSLLAVRAGVAAIVGAFLAGMALSETAEPRLTDLTHGVAELLVPFFLVGIGLRFDPTAFSQPGALTFGAVLVLVAVLSKFAGCGLGALHLGRRDALRVGVGMIPRGEVGMVVAQIGLRMGAIGSQVYAMIVCVSVLTTIAAPPLLKLTFPRTPPPGDASAGEPAA
jgi:Kef-type K+ transport system membrane component KefB